MTLSPTVRLILRALAAAALAALVQIQHGGTQIVWHSVIVGAGLALLEYLTPLNATVGLAKSAPAAKASKP